MSVEGFAVPVLLKAVDFLFEEGSKILKERRERRESNARSSDKQTAEKDKQSVDDEHDEEVIQSKESALEAKIDENALVDSKEEIQHLLSLLEIYTQNYHLAREQYAKWGSALVPPIVVNNLTEAEDEVANTVRRLKDLLDRVYEKEVHIPYLDQL